MSVTLMMSHAVEYGYDLSAVRIAADGFIRISDQAFAAFSPCEEGQAATARRVAK